MVSCSQLCGGSNYNSFLHPSALCNEKENSDERNGTTSRRKTIITEMQRSFVHLNVVLLIVCFKIVFRANNSNDDHNAVNGGQSYSFKNQPDFCCKCDNR